MSSREALDAAAAAVEMIAVSSREALAALLMLWPNRAWVASGCRSASVWLHAFSSVSRVEAEQLCRLAELGHEQPRLAAAMVAGELSLGRASVLARSANKDRMPFLADSVDSMLAANRELVDDFSFGRVVRFWADKVDEETKPAEVPPHAVSLAQSLFGSGHIQGTLSPASFARVSAAIDAFMQAPDPADAAYKRTFQERQADSLDDLAAFALGHNHKPADSADESDESGEVSTKTGNGALVCRFHHRLIHNGWSLEFHDGRWSAVDPDGYRWHGRRHPPPD